VEVSNNDEPSAPDFHQKCGLGYRYCIAARDVLRGLTGEKPIRGFPYASYLFQNLQGVSSGLLNYPDQDWATLDEATKWSVFNRDRIEDPLGEMYRYIIDLIQQIQPRYLCFYPHIGPHAAANHLGTMHGCRGLMEGTIVTHHARPNYGHSSTVRDAINRITVSKASWGDSHGLHHKSSFDWDLRSVRLGARWSEDRWYEHDYEIYEEDLAEQGWDDDPNRRVRWWEEELDWFVDYASRDFWLDEFVAFQDERNVYHWDKDYEDEIDEEDEDEEDGEDGGDDEDEELEENRGDEDDFAVETGVELEAEPRDKATSVHIGPHRRPSCPARGDCSCHPDKAFLDKYFTNREAECEDHLVTTSYATGEDERSPAKIIKSIGSTKIEVYGMFAYPHGHSERTRYVWGFSQGHPLRQYDEVCDVSDEEVLDRDESEVMEMDRRRDRYYELINERWRDRISLHARKDTPKCEACGHCGV
jgi:hypothetical protein